MLKKRAKELSTSSFMIVPPTHLHHDQEIGEDERAILLRVPQSSSADVGISGSVQQLNASLALQTCRTWLQERGVWQCNGADVSRRAVEEVEGIPVAPSFDLPASFLEGSVVRVSE